MKIRSLLFLSLALIQSAAAESPRASMKAPQLENPVVKETLLDIKTTLGIVPDFFKQFPEVALPGAWQSFKAVQLNPNSAIPPKFKELIGLAVSAQVPCHYCTLFHTDAARINGASQAQIEEAVALAAIVREWSTIMNGTQADMDSFKKLTDDFMQKMKDQAAANQNTETAAANFTKPFATADEAYKDIEATFGTVPDFVKKFPEQGIAGAWHELKSLSFNPHTAIPSKYKDLISLGVSAQTPCQYCIYFDTEAAKLDGASEAEINEAIAMASMSRHWSTVLNGMQTDQALFRKQMNIVFSKAKEKMAANAKAKSAS